MTTMKWSTAEQSCSQIKGKDNFDSDKNEETAKTEGAICLAMGS